MALIEAMSETRLCNLALSRIGAATIQDVENPTTNEGRHCQRLYPHVRDSLLRSHWWRFATKRATLSQDTTDPDFEWNNQFDLPNDFLRMKELYDTENSYELEGLKLLTDDDTAEIKYIARITDPTKFDPLFAEVLVLKFAIALCMALGQARLLMQELEMELVSLLARVRVVDKQETSTIGRADRNAWVDEKS